jgi:two-component system, OmpR family, sensor kinase
VNRGSSSDGFNGANDGQEEVLQPPIDHPHNLGLLRKRLRRLPLSLRLAGVSALICFVVLGIFAISVALISANQLRNNFHHDAARGATAVKHAISSNANIAGVNTCRDLRKIVVDDQAEALLISNKGKVICASKAIDFGAPSDLSPRTVNGYYVVSREFTTSFSGISRQTVVLQYARPISQVEQDVSAVRTILLTGVLIATFLIFLLSFLIARITLSPIVDISNAAKEIERTLDASRKLETPHLTPELADLSQTLDGMVHALEGSRVKNEALLKRQREFLADASHELGTPLTSLLANLEFIVDELQGEHSEAGEAALRSAVRLKTLVADLMLLARTDAERPVNDELVDLAQLARDAAAEAGPLLEDHQLVLDLKPAIVAGNSDDLYRVILNLLANSARHTPAGTTVDISSETNEDHAILAVDDDGPGVDPALAPKIFERFEKGKHSRKGSTGLGLAIVRAVTEAHSGTVELQTGRRGHGARFVVTLPAAVHS